RTEPRPRASAARFVLAVRRGLSSRRGGAGVPHGNVARPGGRATLDGAGAARRRARSGQVIQLLEPHSTRARARPVRAHAPRARAAPASPLIAPLAAIARLVFVPARCGGRTSMIDVTVIVVTHNRAAMLRETLTALSKLSRRPSWELLVVDNASTDATHRVVD